MKFSVLRPIAVPLLSVSMSIFALASLSLLHHRISSSRSLVSASLRRAFSPAGLFRNSLPPPGQALDYIPSHAEDGVCWIFTCTDRESRYSQNFSAPGFRHLRLSMPQGFGKDGVHAAWGRTAHLRKLRRTGQKCVIYADDDVYLNLDALRRSVQSKRSGEILVTAGPRHGMEMHINTGFIVFTNLQSKVAAYVTEAWFGARFQPGNLPYHYLKDQTALNRLVKCDFPGVACYRNAADDRRGRKLGLLGHCFSVLEKKRKGAKEECMKKFKTETAIMWDADGRLKMGKKDFAGARRRVRSNR